MVNLVVTRKKVPRKQTRKRKAPEMPSFSQVYEKTMSFEGDQKQPADLIGKEFTVKKYQRRPSKYSDGEYAIVQGEQDGSPFYFHSASMSLMDQLERTAGAFPYRAKLVKKRSQSGREYLSLE